MWLGRDPSFAQAKVTLLVSSITRGATRREVVVIPILVFRSKPVFCKATGLTEASCHKPAVNAWPQQRNNLPVSTDLLATAPMMSSPFTMAANGGSTDKTKTVYLSSVSNE